MRVLDNVDLKKKKQNSPTEKIPKISSFKYLEI